MPCDHYDIHREWRADGKLLGSYRCKKCEQEFVLKPDHECNARCERPKCSNCGKPYEWDEDRCLYKFCHCHKPSRCEGQLFDPAKHEQAKVERQLKYTLTDSYLKEPEKSEGERCECKMTQWGCRDFLNGEGCSCQCHKQPPADQFCVLDHPKKCLWCVINKRLVEEKAFRWQLLDRLEEEATKPKFDGQKFRAEWTKDLRKRFAQ